MKIFKKGRMFWCQFGQAELAMRASERVLNWGGGCLVSLYNMKKLSVFDHDT